MEDGDLETVAELDVPRFMGRWFEVADFPQEQQKDCQCTQANYSLRPTGDVAVSNSCRLGGPGSANIQIPGNARRPDNAEPGKLLVSFFGPWNQSDYWVIELAGDYSFAVVANPAKTRLWILSRTPSMEVPVLEGIKLRLASKGFDLGNLVMVEQASCNN